MIKLTPAIHKIAQLLRLRPQQAQDLMPGGDDSSLGFPGIMLSSNEDEETWGEQEHRRHIDEFERGRRSE